MPIKARKKEQFMIFEGTEDVAAVWAKFVNGELLIKRRRFRWLPGFYIWVPSMGGVSEEYFNADSHEKKYFDPARGMLANVRVKVIPRSLRTGKPNYVKMSVQEKAEMESLKQGLDYWFNTAREMQQYIKGTMSEDRFFETFKRRYKDFDDLKPTPQYNPMMAKRNN